MRRKLEPGMMVAGVSNDGFPYWILPVKSVDGDTVLVDGIYDGRFSQRTRRPIWTKSTTLRIVVAQKRHYDAQIEPQAKRELGMRLCGFNVYRLSLKQVRRVMKILDECDQEIREASK
jgi:hypothetical protein